MYVIYLGDYKMDEYETRNDARKKIIEYLKEDIENDYVGIFNYKIIIE